MRPLLAAASSVTALAAAAPPPRRGGGSSRFLTDVLIELGFTDRERAQQAVEEARSAGVPPERILVEKHAITSQHTVIPAIGTLRSRSCKAA